MTDQAMFQPDMLRGRAINVIGGGSLGSALFQNLIRMNVSPELWDTDVVEARNRFNQRVFEADIGMKKTSSQARIADLIEWGRSANLALRDEKVGPDTKLSGIVLSAVDSMAARRDIWQAVKNNPSVSFFADGRVGLDGGKAYGLDPNNVEHIARYEAPIHLHKDPANAVGACKTEFPLPAIADIVAGHMLMRLARWLHLEQGCNDPYENFVGFYFVPHLVQVTERWDADDEETEQSLLQRAKAWLTERRWPLFWK